MTAPAAGRPALETAQLAITGLMAVLVLVMAAIAGRSLFGTADIVIHGFIGNGVFALALVAALLAFVTEAPGRIVIGAMAFLLLTFAQVGLGYVGRDTLEAAAWHIPNGVLLMGIATFQFASLLGERRGRGPGGAG
ncbi:MAG: hypothetical protein AAGK32_00440 [Actinomycetota bacterium]